MPTFCSLQSPVASFAGILNTPLVGLDIHIYMASCSVVFNICFKSAFGTNAFDQRSLMYRRSPIGGTSDICPIVSDEIHAFSFESLLLYLIVLERPSVIHLQRSLRDSSSSLGVLVVVTGLGPPHTNLPVLTSLFEEEIAVGCWEVLVVVVTIFRDLSCCGKVLYNVPLGGDKKDAV